MLVIGAKGLAKEILEILYTNDTMEGLAFYDDVNIDNSDLLYNKYPILKSEAEASDYFNSVSKNFTLGVGSPIVRYKLYHKFLQLGGSPVSVITHSARISHFDVEIGLAVTIAYNCGISNSVSIKKGALINANTIVAHDSIIGEFCEICPSVNIAGHVEVGDYTFIGTGAIIYPKVKIGKNVSITAGAVIRKNIPDNVIVHGYPSKIIGKKSPFNKSIL